MQYIPAIQCLHDETAVLRRKLQSGHGLGPLVLRRVRLPLDVQAESIGPGLPKGCYPLVANIVLGGGLHLQLPLVEPPRVRDEGGEGQALVLRYASPA